MMKRKARSPALLFSVGSALALAIAVLAPVQTANAAGPTTVGLGTAGSFALLAGTGLTNTGATTITGDVGSSPTHSETGFAACPAADCVTLTGTNHNDPDPNDTVTQGAKTALVAAYNSAFGKGPVTQTLSALGGRTLVGGVYNSGDSTLGLTGTVTLDGQNDPNSVWVFQAQSDLVVATGGSVAFTRGAQPCNVFWQVTSTATLGSGSSFAGSILALTSITMGDGVALDGRAFARNGDVTLMHDTITRSACRTATAPPTGTASTGSRDNSTPMLPLVMLALAFGGLGLVAVDRRRRNLNI
jgi:hypothetical protein